MCKSLGIDSHEVIDIFFRDRVLNISAHYLRPGYAFGGACLPKDLSALAALARNSGVSAPLLDSVNLSNEAHIARAIDLIRRCPRSAKLGFLGVSFKTGTDDVRNSPTVAVINALREEGYNIRVFDDFVSLALKSGRNAATTRAILGEIEGLLVESGDEFLQHAEVVVVGKMEESFDAILAQLGDRELVDLVHVKNLKHSAEHYSGLAW